MVIAFSGAGGKTSAIYAYAGKLVSEGKRVIITTTTHMQYPEAARGPLCTTADEAAAVLSSSIPGKQGMQAVCGRDAGTRGGIHRITGLPAGDFETCRRLCDDMLVEADGAAMLPLKAPDKTEPVIPRGTDAVVICAGLDSVGRKLNDVCFRQEITAELLYRDGLLTGKITADGNLTAEAASHLISVTDIAHILYRGYMELFISNACCRGTALYVLLNKADTPDFERKGVKIAEIIAELVKETTGSLCRPAGASFCGTFITSFYKEICRYEPYI